MNTFLLYLLLTTAAFYLGSYATITAPLWSRVPRAAPGLWAWLNCPACAGTWYGAAVALVVGRAAGLSYLGLDPYAWWTPVAVGFASMVTTTIGFAVLQGSLYVKHRIDSYTTADAPAFEGRV